MKSGPCFKPFELWQKCILAVSMNLRNEIQNQSDADSFIKNCGEITMILKDCVDAHPEYYGNLSQPQRDAESEEATKEATESTPETEVVDESPVPEEPLPESEVPTISSPAENSSE